MEKIAYLVLAAGLGRRMRSSLPKVLHQASGKPLISHVLCSALANAPQTVCIVTGHGSEQVKKFVQESFASGDSSSTSFLFALQSEQRGTGDAVKSGLAVLKDFVGTIVIVYGDMPLLKAESLSQLVSQHRGEKATISLLTCSSSRTLPYGRIIRKVDNHQIEKIVEARDCSSQQLAIREYNVGVYAVDSSFLQPAIEALTNNNAQGEYYLTDIVAKAAQEGQNIHSVLLLDEEELLGVNDPYDLHQVEKALNRRRIKDFVLAGVTVTDESSLWIDPLVSIEPGVFLGPNIQLRGACRLMQNSRVEGSCYLSDTEVGAEAVIKFGVRAERAIVGTHCHIGPFAHLREGSVLGSEVKIGNFVETKKAVLAHGAKASHLSYLGDCQVGENSNVGAGTITCNYDGRSKHQTIIGKDCFIGSDSVLIAPVTIGDGAYIGAGSAISKNVDGGALAFTRPPLTIKAGWAARRAGSQKK